MFTKDCFYDRCFAINIYYAQRGGWDASAATRANTNADVDVDEDGDADREPLPSPEDTDSLREGVRGVLRIYDESDDMAKRDVIHLVALLFTEHRDFVKPREAVGNWRSVLYRYDPTEGIYRPDGEEHLESDAARFDSGDTTGVRASRGFEITGVRGRRQSPLESWAVG